MNHLCDEMNMSNVVAYVRLSPKYKDFEAHVSEIKDAYPNVKLFTETGIKGYVPAEERPVFQSLDEQLQAGDTLVVWWISALGRDFECCNNTMRTLLAKGVHIQTINQSLSFTPDCVMTDVLMKLVQGYAEAESRYRRAAAEFGRKALRDDPEEWKAKFRGRRADKTRHQKIAALLLEGKTLQVVADEAQTSISTVKRVKAKLSEAGEVGDLRRRYKHHHVGHCQNEGNKQNENKE
ncbi:recombinase family protein [Photobacterium profundum]|uniref:Putative recombinase n=2 Tax=Photobacterium profundum TaxID=74109 RepID=Q1Z3H8_9GAMM|nr:putative recombinase [Photobacterium profundum 3TCK]PSV62014.1 recombinase family protein [Photobacterium profundum]